jgi:hypothetical protein
MIERSHHNLSTCQHLLEKPWIPRKKLTQSPSFCCAGTPISSKVFGPLPGGFTGAVDDLAGGLGVPPGLESGFFASGGLEYGFAGASGAGLSIGIVCELWSGGFPPVDG